MAAKDFWRPGRIWKGQTVFVLGGGPSLLDMNLELIHQHRCIGCNESFMLGSWVDACIFGDLRWWNAHKDADLRHYHGLKVSLNKETLGVRGIRTMKRKPRGIWTVPGTIGWNRNTGIAAVNLAIIFGAARIVLVGYDMKWGPCLATGSGFCEELRWVSRQAYSNWHVNILEQGKNRHQTFIDAFTQCHKGIMATGVDVVNATPDSALKIFPFVDFKEVAQSC